jgi:hypothetical protein
MNFEVNLLSLKSQLVEEELQLIKIEDFPKYNFGIADKDLEMSFKVYTRSDSLSDQVYLLTDNSDNVEEIFKITIFRKFLSFVKIANIYHDSKKENTKVITFHNGLCIHVKIPDKEAQTKIMNWIEKVLS